MSAPRGGQAETPLTLLTLHLRPGYSLACRHCWPPALPAVEEPQNGGSPADTYLTAKAVEQALHEALPLGLRGVRLCGSPALRGDVLLHPEIDLLLDRLESLELRVEVETSGAGLTPERAARLARLPQCSVVMSLSGANAQAHDALHLPGAFTIVTEGARLLAESGLPPEIVFAVLRGNARQLPAAVRLAGELGARRLRFVPAHPPLSRGAGFGSAPTRIHKNGGQTGPLNIIGRTGPLSPRRVTGSLSGSYLRVEELIALGRKVERELTINAPLPLVFDQPPAFRGLHAAGRVESQSRCAIRTSLSVLPGGWYALCGAAMGLGSPPANRAKNSAGSELIFGKVGADSLRRIWYEHPTLLLLRESIPDRLEGVCERCLLKRACLGYCPAENFCSSGQFWTPFWFCEAADRAGLFPASRLIENSW